MTREQFLEQAIAAAQESSKSSGLPAGITVAQAALESAWGNSELSRRARNYFGIKAHGKHPPIEMPTTEFASSVTDPDGSAGATPAQGLTNVGCSPMPKRVNARFAVYADINECFACRDRLLLNGSVYAEARTCTHDPEAFARALAKHWATDPKYAEKLLRVYRENDLSRLDDHVGNMGNPAL